MPFIAPVAIPLAAALGGMGWVFGLSLSIGGALSFFSRAGNSHVYSLSKKLPRSRFCSSGAASDTYATYGHDDPDSDSDSGSGSGSGSDSGSVGIMAM